MRAHHLGIVGALFLAACSGDPTTAPSLGAPGEGIPVTRLSPDSYSFSYYSGFGRPELQVIRSGAELAGLWAELGGIGEPPVIDFGSHMVVVVASGEFNTGGYSAIIDSASVAGGDVRLYYTATSPGDNCYTTQALTAPVDVAVVPRSDVDPDPVRHNTVHSCS
jgi:hypothetical protein